MRRLAAALALLPSLAFAHEVAQPPGAHSKNLRLAAKDMHEECLEIAAGRRLSYVYTGSKAVQFTIHYRIGDQIFHPVRRAARHLHGEFDTREARSYCMTWANPHASGINLSYHYIVRSTASEDEGRHMKGSSDFQLCCFACCCRCTRRRRTIPPSRCG